MSVSFSLPPISPFPVSYFVIVYPIKQFLSLVVQPFCVPPQLSRFPLVALFSHVSILPFLAYPILLTVINVELDYTFSDLIY